MKDDRDPQQLGEALLKLKESSPDRPLSELYDCTTLSQPLMEATPDSNGKLWVRVVGDPQYDF